jgi:glycosyltransferase involved in cell wall biosynthesis
MKPSFCIVTTTYRRPDAVIQCVQSVQKQTCPSWTHIIVIDDPVSDYTSLHSLGQNDEKIVIVSNETNRGKNASVNVALDHLRTLNFTGYVLYLDDDDWLAPTCLEDFSNTILTSNKQWLVSQRVSIATGTPFTINKTGRSEVSYTSDCLITKKFQGDVTHCINFPSVRDVRFSSHIKNAEEWLYFAQVSKKIPKFTYLKVPGTYSNGYTSDGLTDQYHKRNKYKENTILLWQEIWEENKSSLSIIIYMILRSIRTLGR